MRLHHRVERAALLAAVGVAAPAAAQLPVPPTRIGINLTSTVYYSGQRAFANLVIGDTWRLGRVGQRWADMPAANIGPDGGLLSLPPGASGQRVLTPPATPAGGTTIRCTWAGSADVSVDRRLPEVRAGANSLQFRWDNKWDGSLLILSVGRVNPAQPLRDLDCREADLPRATRFDPAFVRSLAGYASLRFMDWQEVNLNLPVSWATRTTPRTSEVHAGHDGVAVEDMVALSREVGADPWFTMPWGADALYVTRFAQLVHDTLPADRRVYVEVGNEIWNRAFPAARQAIAEGRAGGLTGDDRQVGMSRYAERTVEVMRIWETVFADRPRQLVRVASTQHVLPATADMVLGHRDTAAHVDALATAPYFGFDVMREGATTSPDVVLARLAGRVDEAIAQAAANKAVAARHGKRYIAYEAGQHVSTPGDTALNQAVQRAPAMYQLYRTYLDQWRRRIGDTIMMFATAGTITDRGGFGLAEHSGQSLGETPKLRAVREALGR